MCKFPALKQFLFYVGNNCLALSKQIIGEHYIHLAKQTKPLRSSTTLRNIEQDGDFYVESFVISRVMKGTWDLRSGWQSRKSCELGFTSKC